MLLRGVDLLEPLRFSTELLSFKSEDERQEYLSLFTRTRDLYAQGEFSQAHQVLSALEKKWPYWPEVLGWLGVVNRELGNIDLSIEYLQRAVKASPRSELTSICLFNTLTEAAIMRNDWGYRDRALEEAKRFILLSGRPSVQYEYILKEMNDELSDEELQEIIGNRP